MHTSELDVISLSTEILVDCFEPTRIFMRMRKHVDMESGVVIFKLLQNSHSLFWCVFLVVAGRAIHRIASTLDQPDDPNSEYQFQPQATHFYYYNNHFFFFSVAFFYLASFISSIRLFIASFVSFRLARLTLECCESSNTFF